MTSVNTHDITVIQKEIKITKVDKTNENQTLTGAVFALYRVDADGTADVSGYNLPTENNYTLVNDTLTVDSNGVVSITPLIPDTESIVGKTIYVPNNTIGAAGDNHDTVYYLVEKTPPDEGYAAMPGAISFKLNLRDVKPDKLTSDDRARQYHTSTYKDNIVLYDWTQTAVVKDVEEVNNGTIEYLIDDGESENIYAIRVKNGKSTDITLIKVDKVTQNSIGGAKFSLLKGSENVDLTKLTITAISDGAAVTPENYDFNGTTIKVVTVPEGGIRIAGLTDDTYTLREVSAPAGYVITDSGKVFKTENGVIKNTDDSAHQNEATNIVFLLSKIS